MKNWLLWLVVGLISIGGGIFALANPTAATAAVERIAGWVFLLVGVLQMITAIRERGFGAKVWALLIGLAGVFVGISLLANPLAGVVSLTLLLAILLLVTGIFKIVMAVGLRGTQFFALILISGILSVLLSLMIFSNFPIAAVKVLGVLLAVELISNGVSLIALALLRKASLRDGLAVRGARPLR